MKEKKLNIPNVLTAIRLLLSIPSAWAIYSGEYLIAVGVFILAFITDFLDGFIARRFNQSTEFGRMLDPLADKTLVCVSIVLMFVRGLLPIWFIAVILGRDLLILLGGLFALRRTKVVLPSNNTGRAAVVSIGIAMLTALAGFDDYVFPMMMLATAMSLVSIVVYSVGMVKKLKEVQN
jgi:cardiolipin synthase